MLQHTDQILSLIDATLARNTLPTGLFTKVMDLLDNPTQYAYCRGWETEYHYTTANDLTLIDLHEDIMADRYANPFERVHLIEAMDELARCVACHASLDSVTAPLCWKCKLVEPYVGVNYPYLSHSEFEHFHAANPDLPRPFYKSGVCVAPMYTTKH